MQPWHHPSATTALPAHGALPDPKAAPTAPRAKSPLSVRPLAPTVLPGSTSLIISAKRALPVLSARRALPPATRLARQALSGTSVPPSVSPAPPVNSLLQEPPRATSALRGSILCPMLARARLAKAGSTPPPAPLHAQFARQASTRALGRLVAPLVRLGSFLEPATKRALIVSPVTSAAADLRGVSNVRAGRRPLQARTPAKTAP